MIKKGKKKKKLRNQLFTWNGQGINGRIAHGDDSNAVVSDLQGDMRLCHDSLRKLIAQRQRIFVFQSLLVTCKRKRKRERKTKGNYYTLSAAVHWSFFYIYI